MITKEEGKKLLLQKVKIFKEHFNQYKLESYKEDRLKTEFIEPFFSALGWDIKNDDGLPEQYKEVIKEDELKIGSSTKEPDYAFRLFGKRQFLVEVKKPSVNIKDKLAPAFQLRRYAWNAPIPISILTDFEELVIYDCRIKPDEKDKPDVARIKYYTFEEYETKFDEIWDAFSKEAVTKGKFDKYIEETKSKKGTSEVSKEFLEDIEYFRTILAKNIAIRNASLKIQELNFAVQITIDRILFLRICEDRDVEPYEKLKNKIGQTNCYKNFLDYLRYADEKYNSGIFDIKNDKVTTRISIDDAVLREVILKLYYPLSQYQFDVIPIEILGNVYEQFLGKVIRLTPSHQAKVETKNEVKKSGGIFYTPKHIVDYIVENTLGKQIKGKSPKEIEKIKIIDPACGSGSFLISSYTYLLTYHLEYYLNNPSKYKKEIFQYKDGKYYISTEIKKKILMNNIFGVDLDPQAVEVTKLSLLLKVLEHETKDSINQQLKLFQERVLPNLDDNIKCGNSLVGYDFYAETQSTLTDESKNMRINIFDWDDDENGFGKIMKSGKFDIVLGNPPYIQIQKLIDSYPEETKFIQKYYKTAQERNVDIYVPFIEKGLSLLKENGCLGFICPNRFFNSEYGDKLRLFLKDYNIYHLVNFRHYLVFQNADTYTCLLFIQKSKQNSSLIYKEVRGIYKTNDNRIDFLLHTKEENENLVIDKIQPHFNQQNNWYFMKEEENNIFNKINKNQKFSDLYKDFFVGVQTSQDKVYICKFIEEKNNLYGLYSLQLNKEVFFEKEMLKPIIDNTNIGSYSIAKPTKYILFPYKINGDKAILYSEKEMKSLYPKAFNYLEENKKTLESREKGKFKTKEWYKFGRDQNIARQHLPKILIPHVVKKTLASIDERGEYCLDNVGANGVILKEEIKEHPYYLIAILNSPIASFFISKISIFLSGGFYASNKQFASEIPIKRIDFSKLREKELHDKIVNLVSAILKQNNRNTNIGDLEERQSNALRVNINKLLFELYSITDKEQEILEKSLSN